MLSYTFSRREKTLILVLAIVLVAIVWYMFVFKGTSERLDQLRSETAQVDEEIAIASAKASQMSYMQKVIDDKKAEGATPTPVPDYDNFQRLSAQLDSVMSAATSYQLSFGELSVAPGGRNVIRPVAVSFQCNSYASAESIVKALAKGPYPCLITAISIVDGSVRGGRADSASCNGTVQVLFFEKNDGSFVVPPTEEELAAAEAAAS